MENEFDQDDGQKAVVLSLYCVYQHVRVCSAYESTENMSISVSVQSHSEAIEYMCGVL